MGDRFAFSWGRRNFYMVNQSMKLDRKNVWRINKFKVLLVVYLLLPIISLGQINNKSVSRNQAVKRFSTKNKTVNVYTTADSSDLRLTLTTAVKFRELKQPV